MCLILSLSLPVCTFIVCPSSCATLYCPFFLCVPYAFCSSTSVSYRLYPSLCVPYTVPSPTCLYLILSLPRLCVPDIVHSSPCLHLVLSLPLPVCALYCPFFFLSLPYIVHSFSFVCLRLSFFFLCLCVLCLSSRPLKKSLWPSGVDVSPKFFQRTSQSPRMFHWYLFISCVSSSTFPAALSDLTFQVPIVMFLARSDFGPSYIVYFSLCLCTLYCLFFYLSVPYVVCSSSCVCLILSLPLPVHALGCSFPLPVCVLYCLFLYLCARYIVPACTSYCPLVSLCKEDRPFISLCVPRIILLFPCDE